MRAKSDSGMLWAIFEDHGKSWSFATAPLDGEAKKVQPLMSVKGTRQAPAGIASFIVAGFLYNHLLSWSRC